MLFHLHPQKKEIVAIAGEKLLLYFPLAVFEAGGIFNFKLAVYEHVD